MLRNQFRARSRASLQVAVGSSAVGLLGVLAWMAPVLLDHRGLLPHGHCYLWQPSLLWLNFSSDLSIGLAYVAISVTLAWLVFQGRSLIPFSWMFVAFGTFIIACGVTHFMEAWTIWTPVYRLSVTVKMVTAVVSVATAILLPGLVPTILQLVRSAQQVDVEACERERIGADNAALAAVVATCQEAIITTNLAGVVRTRNEAADALFGVTGVPERLVLGKHVDIIPGLLARLRRGEQISRFETAVVREDGSRVPVTGVVSAILDGTGRVEGASIVLSDITAQRRAEEELRSTLAEMEDKVTARTVELSQTNAALVEQIKEQERTEQRFTAAVKAAPTAMLIVDGDGRITFANGEAERTFGYPSAELVGQSVELLVPDRHRAAHPTYRAAFLAHPEAILMAPGREVTARHRDGHEVDVEIALSSMETARGVAVLATISDVSAHKRAERELRNLTMELLRSNRELEEFAYVASHDLQEPLRMVASYTQLLRHRYAGRLDADADDFIDFAVDGAVRMQSLIQDLLAYSRVGRGTVVLVPTDPARALDVAQQNLAAMIQDSGALITADPLPMVLADGRQLTQLFQNLITNAIKFRGAASPHVHLGANRVSAGIAFALRDNGIGIDPKHADRIFQIFQRLHTRREYPGSGIGLAICKKIVERHGGTIWVESQPGEGSTFLFTIPAAPALAAHDQSSGASRAPSHEAAQ